MSREMIDHRNRTVVGLPTKQAILFEADRYALR